LSKTCLNFWQNMYQFLVNQNVSWQYFTLYISMNTWIIIYN
jgi:hypothetical protein